MQHYKLRLSDGTIMVVDYDGMTTWLVDQGAMVQTFGSSRWCPLREFMAGQRAAAEEIAEQQKSNTSNELPLVYPEPRKQTPRKPKKGGRGSPGAPPSDPAGSSIGEPAFVQSLADEPGDPRRGSSRREPTPHEDLPAIRLKPLPEDDARDEELPAIWDGSHAHAGTARGTDGDEQDDFPGQARSRYVLDPRLVRAADMLGAFLSRSFEHVTGWSRGTRSRAPGRTTGTFRSAPQEPHPSRDDLPIIRLKPLDDDRAPLRTAQTLFRSLGSKASAWAQDLNGRVARLTHGDRPSPSDPWNELKAPPPIRALPVLRLAESHEAEEKEQIYEGGESLFHGAWLWTKRMMLMTALLGGGIYAALSWETWFPKASEVLTEMDAYRRSRELMSWQQRALQDAIAELPHLSPGTIELLLSESPTGVLPPSEVFQLGWDAADRGLSALTPEEARELRALQGMLLDALNPADRENLLEYDRVRARRITFSFEDRSALELFARGTRKLPSPSSERLQALFGKAITAGLAQPRVAPQAAADR